MVRNAGRATNANGPGDSALTTLLRPLCVSGSDYTPRYMRHEKMPACDLLECAGAFRGIKRNGPARVRCGKWLRGKIGSRAKYDRRSCDPRIPAVMLSNATRRARSSLVRYLEDLLANNPAIWLAARPLYVNDSLSETLHADSFSRSSMRSSGRRRDGFCGGVRGQLPSKPRPYIFTLLSASHCSPLFASVTF